MTTTKAQEQTELAKMLYSPSTRNENAETAKPSNAPTEAKESRRRTIMVAMWQRMTDYFGPQWEASYGNVDSGTIYAWTGSLNRYSEAELAGAIRACEEWDGSFPPTFGQFKALVMAARSKPNATEQRMALEKSAGKPVAMIEHLARSAVSEISQRELARMYDLLAGKEIEENQTSYHNCGLGSRWA